jgi:hypothetical protein
VNRQLFFLARLFLSAFYAASSLRIMPMSVMRNATLKAFGL